jgi:hypothetical protein
MPEKTTIKDRTMTEKEKWLLGLAIQCVNWGCGADFKFREILCDHDLEKHYGVEPYPDHEFCFQTDEEWYAASNDQKKIWMRESSEAERVWFDSRDEAVNKVQKEVTELLVRLRDGKQEHA